jgi:hypothetical protein
MDSPRAAVTLAESVDSSPAGVQRPYGEARASLRRKAKGIGQSVRGEQRLDSKALTCHASQSGL